MIEEFVIHEIRIDAETTGRGDSYSRMTSLEVIMPLKLQSIMEARCRMRCCMACNS